MRKLLIFGLLFLTLISCQYLNQLNSDNSHTEKNVKRVPVIPENAFLAGKEDKLNWFLINSIHNHKNNAQISIYDYNTGELIINKRFLKICPIDEMKFIEDLKEEIDFYDGEKIQLKDNCYLQAN
ncbi:hypothetical protein [Aquimarina rhabdastrellae]